MIAAPAFTEPHVGTLVPPPDPPRKRTPDGWIFYSSHFEYECSGTSDSCIELVHEHPGLLGVHLLEVSCRDP